MPGEAKGIVKKARKYYGIRFSNNIFWTNKYSKLQFNIWHAFNAVANGGTLIQPHVMKEVSHDNDNDTKVVDETFEPEIQKCVSAEKTAKLRDYLERTVTSRLVQVTLYRRISYWWKNRYSSKS